MSDLDAAITPLCRDHGPMVLRPLDRQTPEQLWCGIWHDCAAPWCRNAHLSPSPELAAQYANAAPDPNHNRVRHG